MNPRLKRVKSLPNYILQVEFESGELGRFDVKPYLEIGVFRQLKEKSYFSKAKVSLGAVTWPEGQDFCPDTVYENSLFDCGITKKAKTGAFCS